MVYKAVTVSCTCCHSLKQQAKNKPRLERRLWLFTSIALSSLRPTYQVLRIIWILL